jgi:hypothetical protein
MSTISAGTTNVNSFIVSTDTTGNLVFQTANTTTALTLDSSQNATFAANVSVKTPTGSYTDVAKGVAKAWVNFNGTTSPGTIRGSFNVASVTRTATGVYVVNFTTPMPDANYAVSTIGNNTSSNILFASLNGVPTTTNCPVQAYSTTANVNVDYFMFIANGS